MVAKFKPKIPLFKGSFIVIVIVIIIVISMSVSVVSDGTVGIKKTLGSYNNEELGTGVHLIMPVISSIEIANTKTQTHSETIEVPSKEGLIVDLDISVIFNIKPERASEIKQTVTGDIRETLLMPFIRNGMRDLASGYDASALYAQDTRELIGEQLKVKLTEKIGDDIFIKDVLLRKVTLPDKVKDAIEDKLDAEQKAQQKEFELQSAVKDAEIEVARAEGVAEANKIISQSITKEYLQYKFIEGLNDGNTEVIYVPTEANIPILEVGRLE